MWVAVGIILGAQFAMFWALSQMNDKMDRYHIRQDEWLVSILRKVDPYDCRVNSVSFYAEHVRDYYIHTGRLSA